MYASRSWAISAGRSLRGIAGSWIHWVAGTVALIVPLYAVMGLGRRSRRSSILRIFSETRDALLRM